MSEITYRKVGKYEIAIDYVNGWSSGPDERNYCNLGGFIIGWGAVGIGFGTLTFYYGKDGKLHCDNECMSPDFCRAVLEAMMLEANLDDAQEAEGH